MKLLATDFPFKEAQAFIPIFEEAPVADHEYGGHTSISSPYLVWQKYINPSLEPGFNGSIWFSRKTNIHVPQFTKLVSEWISDTIKIPVVESQIHMMKTIGGTPVHVDEGPRRCAINIGIQNSSVAKTLLFEDDTVIENVVEEGDAYLLNVKRRHAVYSTQFTPRYLATYSIGQNYDEVINLIQVYCPSVLK